MKFELSLLALKTSKPPSKRPEVVGRDLALAEGLAGRNEPVLADTPADPCAGEIVATFDMILQQLGDLKQCYDSAAGRRELLQVIVVVPV